MKVFLVNIGSLLPEHVQAVERFAKDHEILYWVRLKDVVPLDTSKFPNTVFHDYRDALKNIPPENLDIRDLRPWSAQKIMEHFETESELMSMMDKWYPDWPVSRRKDFYYDLLSYWGQMLERFSPEVVIFHAPPHEMFSYVLYAIVRKQGIRCAMFDCILGQDRVILCEDYREGNKALAREVSGGFMSGPGTLEGLSKDIRKHYEEVSRSKNPTPQYVAGWKVEALGWGKFRRRAKALVPFIKDGTIFERGVLRFFKLFKTGALDEQRTCENPADFSKQYVYFPLHYQPECTTSPQGGIFVDQVLAIKMLSAALPAGWELYVKEHPAQTQAHGNEYTPYRYKGFFHSIAKLSNVRLVPATTNTFELTKHAKAVATISGTAGWEAVLRGKPALVFGYPWFMHAPGIFRISSPEECELVFGKIADGFVPDTQLLINYLTRVEDVSFLGYTSGYGKKIAAFDEDIAVAEMHRALEAALAL